MERMTSQLVRSGVPEQRAREEARKRAAEADRQERDKR
jgi:Na+-transporting methylmalonyl-CoA/oxaloacetate decarboxylase gamma subunit